MFESFPKLTRFSQDWTVTEKIDGSNAQIFISEEGEIKAGSRKRFLEPTKQGDNMGFAKWVYANAQALILLLGPGRHFGEWWGQGIQRGYDLKEKRFSLFNVSRWKEEEVNHIPGLHVVPSFAIGEYYDNPGAPFQVFLNKLHDGGSLAAPGYMNPEGIVMFHGRSNTGFKKTFDYDEKGKWAELTNNK